MEDLYADKRPLLLGVLITLIALSIIIVALRFLTRRLSGAGYWWDDWLILAALVRAKKSTGKERITLLTYPHSHSSSA